MNLIQELEREQIARLTAERPIPDFGPGDTVRVNVKVIEGNRERVQAFEGVVIARRNRGINSSFTVRKISFGEGVERVFPLYSPRIDSIEVVRKGLERQLKSKPASFMDKSRASLIELGTTEELEKLKDCDWIVEVIVEKVEPKQALFARLEALGSGAIVSSNTSGIPMKTLLEGRGEAFRRRFLGTHFFAPVRYLHLLELIPTPDTDPAVLNTMQQFAERILGKGTVICKDAPGFIANRLGVYGMSQAMRLMMEEGLSIDEVDALTGPLVGRPKSATFRTGDISGLDVLKLVSTELSHTTGENFAMPEWVEGLIAQGHLGEKTGAGFYKKDGKEIYTYDYTTGEYKPQQKLRLDEIGAIKDLPLAERLRKVGELPGKYGAFAKKLFLTTAHYALEKAQEIAYEIVDGADLGDEQHAPRADALVHDPGTDGVVADQAAWVAPAGLLLVMLVGNVRGQQAVERHPS